MFLLWIYTVGHYDIFMIASEDDQENATKLVSVLQKFSATSLTVHPELTFGQNLLDHLRSGLACSNYRFIFIDDHLREDDFAKFAADVALMKMINRRDESIIPVTAHTGVTIPYELEVFYHFSVNKLLHGKRLDDIVVDSLTEEDVNMSLLHGIVKTVSKSVSSTPTKMAPAEQ